MSVDIDKAKETKKRYYQNNKDRIQSYRRKWKEEHIEQSRISAVAATRRWRLAHPEQERLSRKRKQEALKHKRSLDPSYRKYWGLPTPTHESTGICECCGKPPKPGRGLVLDHCHDTGQFRGWLCAGCNLGLGGLGDTAEGLLKALGYLARHLKRSLQ